MQADAPLAGGRYVIYGCPECADLACGAVTAVIERDGDDFVWRDFAWQTEEEADLKLNGYTGIGPFRFHGSEYRDALQSLLRESDAEHCTTVEPTANVDPEGGVQVTATEPSTRSRAETV